jgi:hypothetical protein
VRMIPSSICPFSFPISLMDFDVKRMASIMHKPARSSRSDVLHQMVGQFNTNHTKSVTQMRELHFFWSIFVSCTFSSEKVLSSPRQCRV